MEWADKIYTVCTHCGSWVVVDFPHGHSEYYHGFPNNVGHMFKPTNEFFTYLEMKGQNEK